MTETAENEVKVNNYARYRFNMFARRIKNPPPWELIDEDFENELKEVFGEDFQKDYQLMAAVISFSKATGGLPKDKQNRLETLRLIRPLLQGPASDIVARIHKFMQASRSLNIVDCYERGQIKPELAAILNDTYEMTEDLYKHNYAGPGLVRSGLIPYLIEEKKLDFSPYRGKDDTEDDWYFNYRISTSPLPSPVGYPAMTLDRVRKTAEKEYATIVSSLKDAVMRSLSGIKISDSLKNAKNLKPDQDGYVQRPIEPEVFLRLVSVIDKQYQLRQTERTPKDFAAPFTTEQEAGFYINPITCKIYDLRPYTKDLHDLLSVNSWQYLADFAAAIREVVTGIKEEPEEGESLLQSLFPDTYYVMPADKKNSRNIPISKPVKRQIRAYATANISGQGINLVGRKGEVLQTVAFADATGKPSEQVITSFDISIQNCVGSLQQKNAGKVFFTDIEIAKEFNSTPDKQGHITPDSQIVQEVRASMKRLSSVYGKIDVTEQITAEMQRRHPNDKKIKRLKNGLEKLAIMQPLVKIDRIGVHTLKNDRDTLCYCITEAPPFYLHGALTRQMIQVPFEQLNSRKSLTTEIRLLREYTRINIEAAISMQKEGLKADTIRFNKILDDTFRTSADPAESVEKLEITQVVNKIPAWKRYKLQTQILNYLDELKEHKFIRDYTVIKKKLPGKAKNVEYGFTITTYKPSE